MAKIKAFLHSKYIPKGEYDVDVSGPYEDGSLAIQISKDGKLWSRPTAFAAGVMEKAVPKPLRSSFALVKEYSENEGVAKALEDAGILKRMCTIPIGFGYGYLCQINERMLK